MLFVSRFSCVRYLTFEGISRALTWTAIAICHHLFGSFSHDILPIVPHFITSNIGKGAGRAWIESRQASIMRFISARIAALKEDANLTRVCLGVESERTSCKHK
jgi:hypothetical protein